MPASQHQIREAEQREQLRGVLRQAAKARFAMTEKVLHHMERMLDFRPNAGLQVLQLFGHAAELVVGQRLAFGAHHRDMPGPAFPKIFFTFFDALVACVIHCRNFIAMQQRVGLRNIRHIAGRADQGVHEARRRVHADVRLEPKVPVVAFFGLVHFRIA